MPRRPLRLAALSALVVLVAVTVVSGCGGPSPPSSEPTPVPPSEPLETPAPAPGGPLTALGPIDPATYETPAGFSPAFSFDLRTDGWRVAVVDELGFTLVTPAVTRIEAIVGVTTPIATTVAAFEAELAAGGFLVDGAIVADTEIGGIEARSFSADLPEPAEAYRMATPDGEITTSFGGDLSRNELVFVAHPERPFVLVFSAAAGPVEARFAFDALAASIEFRD